MSDDILECENADRELWRGPDEGCGDYYADRIFVTKGGGIGIDCGGSVIVRPLREWHRLATEQANYRSVYDEASPGGICHMGHDWKGTNGPWMICIRCGDSRKASPSTSGDRTDSLPRRPVVEPKSFDSWTTIGDASNNLLNRNSD